MIAANRTGLMADGRTTKVLAPVTCRDSIAAPAGLNLAGSTWPWTGVCGLACWAGGIHYQARGARQRCPSATEVRLCGPVHSTAFPGTKLPYRRLRARLTMGAVALSNRWQPPGSSAWAPTRLWRIRAISQRPSTGLHCPPGISYSPDFLPFFLRRTHSAAP